MDNDLQEVAKEALLRFMAEMHEWESAFYREKIVAMEAGNDAETTDEEARTRLREIFNKFVIEGKRNTARLIDLGCLDPPTYDPKLDLIEEISGESNEIVIRIRQGTGMRNRFRFVLKLVDRNWKIKKMEFLNYKNKWQSSAL